MPLSQMLESQFTMEQTKPFPWHMVRTFCVLKEKIPDFVIQGSTLIILSLSLSVSLSLARLVMANQSFTTLSSFGIYPVIGTFGDGYFQKGNRGVNPFNIHLPHYFSNLHMMEAPKLGTGQMWRMDLNAN